MLLSCFEIFDFSPKIEWKLHLLGIEKDLFQGSVARNCYQDEIKNQTKQGISIKFCFIKKN